MAEKKEEYTASSIKILEGLEAVRKRPAMYIGDTYARGYHHLLYEVLDNSIDEALAGYCTEIRMTLKADGSAEVIDNGRGIPVDIHPDTGKSALEVVTTILHAGGKFDNKNYKVSGGLHGVGISVVNALSEWMTVEVHREGQVHMQRYERGVPMHDVKVTGTTGINGTAVRFRPDTMIFGEQAFDSGSILSRLREEAFLNPKVKIMFSDEASKKEETFYSERGLADFVETLDRDKPAVSPVLVGSKAEGDVQVDFALQYVNSYSENICAFANSIKNEEGGTHLVGFRSALTRVINDFIKRLNLLKGEDKITGDDIREGLTAVIHVRMPSPQFEGQTKTKLGNNEIKGIVDSIVYDTLKEWMEMHPEDGKRISQKVISAMEAREAAKKAKELVRRKSVFETSVLPGKLADCATKKAEEAELFIVEGESAGGSAKQGRDREFQAILPLKGKILNIEKATLQKLLNNVEIKNIILALGTGFSDEFDVKRLRYHKIIIMTDADVDGSHIMTLLLTLFFRYFRPLIDGGYIYVAMPPLYKLKKGRVENYAYSDEEKDGLLKGLGEGTDVQRYKGLGEMNPDQLWGTTMDPNTRKLKKVSIQDAAYADTLFNILMGEEVEPRRKFIEEHALEVKELDV
jgi:DNA gyrase subunit B